MVKCYVWLQARNFRGIVESKVHEVDIGYVLLSLCGVCSVNLAYMLMCSYFSEVLIT